MPVIIFTFSVIVSAGYAQFVTKGNNQKDQVYCRIGEETILYCPRSADNSSVTWLGPPNLIPYTDGKEINNDLRKRLPTDLTITNMTNTHYIFSIEHTELILSCSVRRGNPVETLQWTRNGIHIQNQNVSLSISKDNISEIATLQYSFVSSREDNKDNFTCSAESSITEEPLSKTVYLNVYYTPTVIAAVYPSNEIRESSDISLQCNADANPEVKKYTWQKHGRVLANVSVYNVTKIDRSQTGEYMFWI
ncbi:unnamed protein product [Mytilus edulis]|uniref:Ig-like domain-containing protein n=1 Tax=Mytilus edulis TaxID=6550 RepID=A0A8S3V1Z1_MYTED|nr:unnamed protein product [Mytilus edulis]